MLLAMPRWVSTKTLFIALVVLMSSSTNIVLAQEREISQLNGDLYLFRSGAHLSVFLVTSEGVIATDPINKEAASWLKSEIKERFNKDIKIVIYSHSDADHVSGGEVFAETATIIAHEKALPIIAESRHTALPDKTFSDQYDLRLGDGEVSLHYFGPSHTDNVIVMEFPKQRAIFVVDTLNINRLPYRDLPRFHFPETIDFIKSVEALDFDMAIPGHGELGVPADVVRYREYLEALYANVVSARMEGKSLEEAQNSIKLEQFSDFAQYENWLPLNIEGMYRILDQKLAEGDKKMGE